MLESRQNTFDIKDSFLLAAAFIWLVFFALGLKVTTQLNYFIINLTFAVSIVLLNVNGPVNSNSRKIAASANVLLVALTIYKTDATEEVSWLYIIYIALAVMALILSGIAINKRLAALAAAAFLYSVFSPLLTKIIETRGDSINEVITYHWYGLDSIFSWPFQAAIALILPVVFFCRLYSLLQPQDSFRNFFSFNYSIKKPADSAFYNMIFAGPVQNYFINEKPETEKTLPLFRIIREITPPVLGAVFFLAAFYSNVGYPELIKRSLLLIVIVFISGFYNHLYRSDTTPKELFTSLFNIYPLLLKIGFFVSSAYLFSLLTVYFATEKYPYTISLLTGYFLYLVLYLLDQKHSKLRGIFNFVPLIIFCSGLFLPPDLFLKNVNSSIILLIMILLTRPLLRAVVAKSTIPLSYGGNYKSLKEASIKTSIEIAIFLTGLSLTGLIIGSLNISGLSAALTYQLSELCRNSLSIAILLSIIFSFALNLIMAEVIICFALSALIMSPVLTDLAGHNSFDLPLVTVIIFLLFINIAFACFLPAARLKFRLITGIKSFVIGIPADNFRYIIVITLLSIMAILDQRLLFFGNSSWHVTALSFFSALTGIVIILIFLKKRFISINSPKQSFILLVAALTFLYPKAWINLIVPPYKTYSGDKILEVAENLKEGDKIKLTAQGIDELGENRRYLIFLKLGAGDSGEKRLASSGLILKQQANFTQIKKVYPGSEAEDLGLDPDFVINEIGIRQQQPNKYLPLIPAILSLIIIGWQQRRKTPGQKLP